jgi:hypothetical protein
VIKRGCEYDRCHINVGLRKHGGRAEEAFMGICEVCHNEYDKTFEVILGGQKHVFDSFECAIHSVAPKCDHCGCPIIGHGIEAGENMFCCSHCASAVEKTGTKDRI